MKFRDLRGVHGVVFAVDDPEREARRWRRALGLALLRKGPREIVLGGLSFFVVLRQSTGEASGLSELHVAVEGLSAPRLEEDSLGGRHASADVGGSKVRIVVRELTRPPSAAWLPAARRGARRRSARTQPARKNRSR
jgi:catechol 2,3-dioxygenase-like lactoylglutathione lyase family enzyme